MVLRISDRYNPINPGSWALAFRLHASQSMATRIENIRRAQLAATMIGGLAQLDATEGTGYWAADDGRAHRAFLNAGLAVGVDSAIDARDWDSAIRLAAALNLGN